MTTQAWVDKHISFALKQKSTDEVILGLQAVCDRLNISPLEKQGAEPVQPTTSLCCKPEAGQTA